MMRGSGAYLQDFRPGRLTWGFPARAWFSSRLPLYVLVKVAIEEGNFLIGLPLLCICAGELRQASDPIRSIREPTQLKEISVLKCRLISPNCSHCLVRSFWIADICPKVLKMPTFFVQPGSQTLCPDYVECEILQ